MNSQVNLLRRISSLAVGGAFVLAASAVVAQGTPAEAPAQPNVLPTNPKSPTDYSAMPPKIRASAKSPKASARGGSAVGGYSGGDMVFRERVRRRGPIPEFHQVKKGDSLWRICDFYYSDPWSWPQLWAYNESITNPHWIYPGDKIRMLAHTPMQRQQSGPGFAVVAGGGRTYGAGPIHLRQHAFVDEKQLEVAAHIVGSKHENKMLSLFQEVYLRGGSKFRPKVGDRFAIYAVKRPLKGKQRKLGHVVEILGTVKVKKVQKGKVVTAEIVEATNVIERGAKVGPLRRTFHQLPSRPANKNMTAHVVDFLGDRKYVSQRQLVFLDRGRKDGVRLGNRFLVVRRGDGNRTLYQDAQKDNRAFPNEPVAEVTVLDLRDHTSVGVVTRAKEEIRRGDKLRMRRGY